MKSVLFLRALLVAVASILIAIRIDNPTITVLTLGIICLGFIANITLYKLLTKNDADSEADSYQSAHSM